MDLGLEGYPVGLALVAIDNGACHLETQRPFTALTADNVNLQTAIRKMDTCLNGSCWHWIASFSLWKETRLLRRKTKHTDLNGFHTS